MSNAIEKYLLGEIPCNIYADIYLKLKDGSSKKVGEAIGVCDTQLCRKGVCPLGNDFSRAREKAQNENEESDEEFFDRFGSRLTM